MGSGEKLEIQTLFLVVCFLQRPLLIVAVACLPRYEKSGWQSFLSLSFLELALALCVEPEDEAERSAPSAGNIYHGRILQNPFIWVGF